MKTTYRCVACHTTGAFRLDGDRPVCPSCEASFAVVEGEIPVTGGN